MIKLEQNYRSTQNILDAANEGSVIILDVRIRHFGLPTAKGIRFYLNRFDTAKDEADFVGRRSVTADIPICIRAVLLQDQCTVAIARRAVYFLTMSRTDW